MQDNNYFQNNYIKLHYIPSTFMVLFVVIGLLSCAKKIQKPTTQKSSSEKSVAYLEDFGAIANDGKDDTQAFLKALTTCTQIKFRSEGMFEIDSFPVSHNLSLIQGNGTGTIIKHNKGIKGSLFKQANPKKRNSGLTVENITFRGNGEATETSVLDLTGFSYCYFNNISVCCGGQDNIYCIGNAALNRQTSNLTFVNLASNSAGAHGFNFALCGKENNTVISITGGNIADNGLDGIHIETGSSVVVKGVSIQGNHRHEIYNDGEYNLFEGVWVEKNSAHSAYHIPMIFSDKGAQNKYSTVRSSLNLESTYRDVSGKSNDYQVLSSTKNKLLDLNFEGGVFPKGIKYSNYGTPNATQTEAAYEIKINDYAEFDIDLSSIKTNLVGKQLTVFLYYRTENIKQPIEARIYGMNGKKYGDQIATWKWINIPHNNYISEFFQVNMPIEKSKNEPFFLRFYPSYPNKEFGFNGIQNNNGGNGKLLLQRLVIYEGLVTSN
jgi:hypothetical protein